MNNALFKEVQIRLEATLFFIGQGVAILIYKRPIQVENFLK